MTKFQSRKESYSFYYFQADLKEHIEAIRL
jgi:hypothetical protein